jgi:hypothetical protein
MSLGEILDASVKVYRNNFVALVIAQLPVTLLYLGNNLIPLLSTGFDSSSLFGVSQPPSDLYADLSRLLLLSLVSLLFALVEIAVVYPAAMSAMTKVASDSILGKKSGAKEGFRFYIRNWFKLGLTNVVFFVALLIILVIVGLFIAIPVAVVTYAAAAGGSSNIGALAGIILVILVIGCIGIAIFSFFWIRLQGAFAVAVNEETFNIEALRRSWNLVKGSTIKTFGVLALVSLIPYALIFTSTFFELLLGMSLGSLTLLFGALSQALLIPLVAATRTVVYFELRARKEGYDLEQRMEQL